LFELIENYDFQELTAKDKLFVLEHMLQEEYDFQRRLITEASTLAFTAISPNPLNIHANVSQRKGIVIPLYQAILAVASVIVFFIFMWPKEDLETTNKVQFSENDTIIQTKIIHDTFVKYFPKIIYVDRNIPQTKIEYVTIYQDKIQDEPRFLEVAQSLNLPPITKESVQNQGNSLKEDQSSRLVKAIFLSN
jgi:hypothetical protein